MDCEIKDWFALHVFCKSHQICSTALIGAVLNYQGICLPVCLSDTQRDRRILSGCSCEALLNCPAFAFSSIVVHHQHLSTFPGPDHSRPAHARQGAHPGGSRVPATVALLSFCTQGLFSACQPRLGHICHIYKYKAVLRLCVGQGRGR